MAALSADVVLLCLGYDGVCVFRLGSVEAGEAGSSVEVSVRSGSGECCCDAEGKAGEDAGKLHSDGAELS